MKHKIQIKIQSLLNKPLKYGVKTITITGYELDEENQRLSIHTNERNFHYERPFDSALALLKEFTPAEVVPAGPSEAQLVVSDTSNLVGELRNVLLENIRLVRDNAEYIPQATSINNNVNSIINLSKLQMDAYKMAERLKNQ